MLFASIFLGNKLVSRIYVRYCRLFRICRIQWRCSLFFFCDRKCPLCANLVQNVKIISLSWNLVSSLLRICRVQWFFPLFFSDQKYPFWENLGQKNKTVSLRWYLIPTIPHINSETNLPPSIINLVSKHLRQLLDKNFGVASLSIYCNIEDGGGAWFILARRTISRNVFRNWVGLNNLSEILSQNLRKLSE